MKKTFFLLFCAGILFSIDGKAQASATPMNGGNIDNSMMTPMLGSEWSVMIVVSDSKSNPVSGAKVTLPCSGQPYEMTDTKGTALFSGAGSCPCSEATVNVTTPKSNVNQDRKSVV